MFVIFSLPRSRSAWLSAFLGRDVRVGHDLGIECATTSEYLSRLHGYAGSCETGAAFAWPLLKERLPDCKFAVVLRRPEDAAASLEREGLPGQLPEMQRRMEDLLRVAQDPGTLTVSFESLQGYDACRLIYQHCLDRPCDAEWWAFLATLNIQLDLPLRLSRLAANHARNEELKAEVRRLLAAPGLIIQREPWSLGLWEEAEPLARSHFEEVDGGVEPNRAFRLDLGIMAQLHSQGALKIITARHNGKLVGYFTWQIAPDPESAGLIKADQGAWYVAAGYPVAAHKMFKRSIEELRACGVKIIFPHHRLQGRGARLGRFFEREGATPIQTTYSLWIG